MSYELTKRVESLESEVRELKVEINVHKKEIASANARISDLEVLAARQKGLTLMDISNVFNISYQTVRNILLRNWGNTKGPMGV